MSSYFIFKLNHLKPINVFYSQTHASLTFQQASYAVFVLCMVKQVLFIYKS